MLTTLHQFGRALRRGGIAVSTHDIVSAARAISAIDVSNRAEVRCALATTLVKRREQRELFDALFDSTFALTTDRGSRFAIDLAALLGGGQEGDEGKNAQLVAVIASLSPLAKALVGQAASDPRSLAAAAGVSVPRVGDGQRIVAAPLWAYRLANDLGLDSLGTAIEKLLEQSLAPAHAEVVVELFRRRQRDIRAQLRRFAEEQRLAAAPRHRQQLAAEALSERAFAGLTAAELAALRTEVDRMARRLIASISRRRRCRQVGRLDVAKTLRRAAMTQGVPFEPTFRHRRRHRPHLIILCDISDSVRNVSQFMLQLVYTAARLTDGVRAFAFVADLGELTEVFRRHSIESAIATVGAGAVVNVLANSNYGSALSQFADRYLGAIRRTSTVIVIGDGRSNYHDPGLDALAKIRSSAGQLLWINPESESLWGFGDSAMNEYRKLCDQVVVAGNLRSFRRVVDLLFHD